MIRIHSYLIEFLVCILGFGGVGSAAQSPIFSPSPGKFASPQSVTITDSMPGAVIYYTLNGNVPTTASRVYTGPIAVQASESIVAIAVSGATTSPYSVGAYMIVPPNPGGLSPNSTSSFFGMNINHLLTGTPWPDIPFDTLRLWDTYTKWSDLNPSPGTFTWGNLDRQISLAHANGAAVMLTFGGTPPWAISTGVPISSITRSGGVVTVNTTAPHGLYLSPIQQPSQQSTFTVSGVTDLSFNGSFQLLGTPTTQTLTYAQTGPDSQSSSGQISAVCGGDYAPSGCAEAPINITDWDNYITQLINHAGPGAIQYYEMWNEANLAEYWRGDPATLAIMAAHARKIIQTVDPNAVILSPSATIDFETAGECASDPRCGPSWLSNWLAAGGNKSIDAVSFHAYPAIGVNPEQVQGTINLLTGIMNQNGVGNLPLWDTESSWGLNTALAAQSDEVNFVARHLILEQSAGIQRSFWYAFDNPSWGTMWSSSTGLNPIADAYVQVYDWISGASLTQPCAPSASSSTTWTCSYSRPNGYAAEIAWDTSATKSFTVPSQFVQYRDLTGAIGSISNGIVQISVAPILLETESGGQAPALTIPVAGSVLPGSSATFMWSKGTIGATAFQIKVGTTGVGSSDVYAGAQITDTSLSISGIPVKGATLYVRLLYEASRIWSSVDYTYRETAETAPSMISPTAGSKLSGPTATFMWNGGVGSTQYRLSLGTTGVGASDLFYGSSTTATSAQVSNIPANGVNVYARIQYYMNNVWSSVDYVYTEAGSPILPSMISPAVGSPLTGSSATFTWNPGAGPIAFQLKIGTTGVGSSNVYNGSAITSNSVTVSVPANGVNLYVRLGYQVNAVWSWIDYLYKEAGTPTPPSLISPAPGSTLTSSSTAFTWNPGAGPIAFQVKVGTTGVGSSNVYSGSAITSNTVTVSVPTNGVNLYVRLGYEVNAVWSWIDYLYQEAGTPTPPSLISPAPGSTLTSSSATFTWNPGAGPTGYVLAIGTTYAGSTDVYNGSTVTGTSVPVTGIPANGATLYVRLYYGLNGTWPHVDYVMKQAGTPTPPSMISPAVGSTLTDSSATFTWNPGAGPTAFQLKVGTTGVGSSNVYNGSAITSNSVTVSVPANGVNLYVRLGYEVNAVWSLIDYVYKEAGTPTPPSIISPAVGSTLAGSSEAFTWNPGAGPTAFQLKVGTTAVGSSNVYSGSAITSSTVTVSVPANGVNLYVRLGYQVNSVWSWIDYLYKEAGTPIPPSLISPAAGSTLTGSSATFTWNPGAGPTGYVLAVGTTYAGSADVYNGSAVTGTTVTVTGIPTNGATLYVRLYYGLNGTWPHVDYVMKQATSP